MLKSLAAEIFGIDVDPQRGGMSLAEFEWRNRVLIILPDDGRVHATRQAGMLLGRPEGLLERDIIVLDVGRTSVTTLFGPNHDLNCLAIRHDLDAVDGVFALVLVGKDGTVKFRSADVVEPGAIFDLIDQMPMRKLSLIHI